MQTEDALTLAPALAERALDAERLGRLPDQTAADLCRLGIARLHMPAAWQGEERGVADLLDVVRPLAGACMSSAWCAAIWGEHPWVLARFERRAQEDVWTGGPNVFVCLSNAPDGAEAVPCEGGFRLTGRWRFVSGCDHAGWFILLAPVAGSDRRRLLLIPRADIAIDHDSWRVAGLRATGSKTVAVQDMFVSAERALDPATAPGITPDMPPLFQQPVGATLGLALAAVALGGAEAALALFRERLGRRVLHMQTRVQAEDPAAQLDLAEAAAQIEAARLLLYHGAEVVRQAGLGRTALSPLDMAGFRLNKVHAVRLCVAAVDRLFAASGGGALLESAPLQRIWRDVHAVQAHASLTWSNHARNYGALALGLPQTNPSLF